VPLSGLLTLKTLLLSPRPFELRHLLCRHYGLVVISVRSSLLYTNGILATPKERIKTEKFLQSSFLGPMVYQQLRFSLLV
jgi:hypothetical protein